jgi:PAS domain S-box-containing protein
MYYVPIILAAYWFRRDGVLYAAGMGLLYLSLVVVITGYNPNNVIAAAGRFFVFVIIAAVVAVLSMRISTQQQEVGLSEKKFRTVWDHVQAGIILVDAQTHEIISANPEAERLTGYPEEEMKGHSCHKFICPAEKGKCPICDLNQKIDRSERVVLNRNGEEVPVLKTVTETTLNGQRVLIENFVAIPRR